MYKKTLAILGMPIEHLDLAGTIEAIIHRIERYRIEHPEEEISSIEGFPQSYISTLSVEYLANSYGWCWSGARHPELLHILRQSSMITPEGLPIVWLSKLLGNPLKEQVARKDLLPLLFEQLAESKQSIFLLGNEELKTQEAAIALQKIHPHLRIVGVDWSEIFVEGDRLVEAKERDALLLKNIQDASPDVLLVCLGHPKQGIWFQRIHRNLRVPISIGAGEILEIVPPPPRAAQSRSLEWLHHLFQEPKRLMKRYVFDNLIFLSLSLPLVIAHFLNCLFFLSFLGKNREKVKPNLLFLSEHQTIAVVRMPKVLNAKNAKTVNHYLEEAFAQDIVILDFYETRHIDLEGVGLLLNTWLHARRKKIKFFGFGIRGNVRILMQVHKVWDLFSPDIETSPFGIMSHFTFVSTLYEAVHQTQGRFTISFFGKLDDSLDFDRHIEKFLLMLHLRHSILDFRYCSSIDNSGFSFLLKIKQIAESSGKMLKITGLSKAVARQFKLAGVDMLFQNISKHGI
ncbi:MAG: WecB/TagA/CpsF family glycosyltransferase [Waddliaceae bacterium]